MNQALGEHEDFFIFGSEDFPVFHALKPTLLELRTLGLRVTRKNVYSSTRNRRSASTETI
jgi:hypothetical protein